MLHKISECKWNEETMLVTLLNSQSELSAVIEFENQDWVKDLAQATNTIHKKNYINPNAAFPFQDNFSVGTIHGTNMKPPSKDKSAEEGNVIKIIEDYNNVSVLTSKTQDELLAILLQERQKSKLATGRRAFSGTNPIVSGPTANATPARVTGTAPVTAEGLQIPPGTSNKGRVDGGLGGK
jgi:hypothetical protein